MPLLQPTHAPADHEHEHDLEQGLRDGGVGPGAVTMAHLMVDIVDRGGPEGLEQDEEQDQEQLALLGGGAEDDLEGAWRRLRAPVL